MSLREEILTHFKDLSEKVDKVQAGLCQKVDCLQSDISELKQSFAKIEVRQDTAGTNIYNLLEFKSQQEKSNAKQMGFLSALAIGWGLLITLAKEIFFHK